MSLQQWGLACLWLAGTMAVVALVLCIVALTDPARRRGGAPAAPAADHPGCALLSDLDR
jgi:hypothetical protein